MKSHKATYSLPEEILHDLNAFVEQRQRSQFVAAAIRYALDLEKKKLEEAYKDASSDKERLKEIEDWNTTEIEGWDG